jgi:uncharacterized protein YaaQ
MSATFPDRLVILNISGAQEEKLFASLADKNFVFTVINTTSGIIQEPEVCLLVGFDRERLPVLLDIVRKDCRPYRKYISARGFTQPELADAPMMEAQLGGARFIMMNVERFEQF